VHLFSYLREQAIALSRNLFVFVFREQIHGCWLGRRPAPGGREDANAWRERSVVKQCALQPHWHHYVVTSNSPL
jgi:hypothetical protein